MTEDRATRVAICNQIEADQVQLGEPVEKHEAALRQLENQIERLRAEREERKRELDSIADILSRIVARPSVREVATEVGIELLKQIRRGRIEGEIREIDARLDPLERQRQETARLAAEARYNLDQTARNFVRYRCGEFRS